MDTQEESILNGGAEPSLLPPVSNEMDVTNEEKEEQQQVEEQKVGDDDFELDKEAGATATTTTTTITTTTTAAEAEANAKKTTGKRKGKRVVEKVSPFVRNVVNLLREAESTEPYFTTPTWRRTPFEPIPYKALKKYEPAPDMPEIDAKYIEEKLNTSLPPGWTDIPPIPKEFQDVIDAHRTKFTVAKVSERPRQRY